MDHFQHLFGKLKILYLVNLYILQILLYTKGNFVVGSQSYDTRGEVKLALPRCRLSKFGNSHNLIFILNCLRFCIRTNVLPYIIS